MLSVIIAALNAEPWLDEQLDALAAQTYRGDFEVLVCDNGSSDGTRDVVARRRPDFPAPLRLVDATGHPGCGFARNVGVSQCDGDVVLFCDADDVVAPEWLDAFARASATSEAVAGRLDTSRLNPRWTQRARPVVAGLQESSFLPFGAGGNMAIRKGAFQAVGGFKVDQVWLEDVDLSWRLQLAGYRLTFEPDALVHVRLRQSLRGIGRQGFVYGQGLAELEARFGVSPPAANALRRSPVSRLRRPLALMSMLVTRPGRGSVGYVLWQVGWHLGYRSPKPPVPPAEEPVTSTTEVPVPPSPPTT
jgi:glycosyltransferase involved in cell wall biosynthesis